MDNSRSSSPEAPPQDLWSSILDSVSSSRSIPAKQILLLGKPSSGKSLIASALLQKPVSGATNGNVSGNEPNALKDEQYKTDFALGYDFADVRDEAEEDILARLSVYTVPTSSPSYTKLLPHFLPPRTALLSSLIIIVLDWTRPWSFVEELESWLAWVEAWAKGDGSRELDIVREEGRERLQSHLQHYTEPTPDPDPDTLPTSNSTLSSTLLPLGPGIFTHNFSGVPIIVVCTKADLIDEGNDSGAGGGHAAMGGTGMVKGKGGEWEEKTDGVMQVLRTICLKYGAALFYTTPLPTTLQILRQYALHLLFMPPAPPPGHALASSLSGPLVDQHSVVNATSGVRKAFPFSHKPNTLDRDRIVVPAGWDSYGKITVLRDGFDCKMWGEAWERDLENDGNDDAGTPGELSAGAKKAYAGMVPDQGPKPTLLPAFNAPTPEQTFLAKNYDDASKKSDRDPRGAFRNPQDLLGAGAGGGSAGIVGPLGASSFNLPNVERALSEMESAVGMTGGLNSSVLGGGPTGERASLSASRMGSQRSTSGHVNNRPAGLSSLGPGPSPTHTSIAGVRSPITPTSAMSPNGMAAMNSGGTGGAQSQHEVLQKFFQDLLNTKDRMGAAPPGGAAPPIAASRKANGAGQAQQLPRRDSSGSGAGAVEDGKA
ncbi:dynein light intermediate chain-domain-containing protein [Crepidotus variabilis]|uniref:Dynein light intermediate chain-domain-containing protein n=1 Tax=Crepidotus variabilis TaxID=179855 RepID=A0A9P6JV47_9AGAR|nr:dynein light intermediate chain-domain-containing protein [Crepidotus variabilis]